MDGKKTVKIDFSDFWAGFDKNDNDFINALRNHFNVEISDEPEYLFYSSFGDNYLNYDCIRIFYTGEDQSPDFNACDYAMGFDRMVFGDRYVRLPIYLIGDYRSRYLGLSQRRTVTKEDLDSRKKFCSFVVSNCLAGDVRGEFFKQLSEYKRVESGGRYLNNIGGPVADKLAFQQECKFAIAFENESHAGYVTEKLMQAFDAYTVPIYYGAPDVELDFRKGSFINCADFNNFDEVIEYVKKVDNDDDLYLQIVNTNPMIESDLPETLERFLVSIFSQDLEKAPRRQNNRFSRRIQELTKRHQWYENHVFAAYNRAKSFAVKVKNGNILR